MELSVELPSLEAQEIVEVREAKLYLEENYLRYILDFDAKNLIDSESEDNILGMDQWSDVEGSYLDVVMKKDSITGVELSSTKTGFWIILILSPSQDLRIYFGRNSKRKAENMKSQLIDWIFNK